MELKSSTPRIKVLLFPFSFTRKEIVSPFNVMMVNEIDATEAVVTTNYSKSKSNPSGTFQIVLKPTRKWDVTVKPGSWVMIYISQYKIDTSGTKGLKCLGIIDRVARNFSIDQDGVKSINYTIDGRDFGKVFERNKMYFDPFIPKESQVYNTINEEGIKITGDPSHFVKSYINLFLGDGSYSSGGISIPGKSERRDMMRMPPAIAKKFGVGAAKNFADVLQIVVGGVDGLEPEGYSWYIAPTRIIENNLWDLIVNVANTAVNEVYLTLKYSKEYNQPMPTLVLRKLPYRKDYYTKLRSYKWDGSYIVSEDLGFSDHERVTWMNMESMNRNVTGYKALTELCNDSKVFDLYFGYLDNLFPYVNHAGIVRYGYMPHVVKTEFNHTNNAEDKGSVDSNDIELSKRWFKELKEIWSNKHRFRSGTIVFKGLDVSVMSDLFGSIFNAGVGFAGRFVSKLNNKSDDISVGDNIYLSDRDEIYHIEGISYNWQAPGILNTTIAVTYGVKGKPGGKYDFFDEYIDDDEYDVGITKTKRD